MATYDYDLFVIGGGSGGVRAARLAAALGKRVAVAEASRFGGTCVIRGCVPKKLFVHASQYRAHFEDAHGYGWRTGRPAFDWKALVAAKDKETARLETLYRQGLEQNGAELIDDRAQLVDAHRIRLANTGRTVTAERILIATGARPNPHPALVGHELCISSDQAFDLAELPRSILIAGGGYIAVEFANIFHALGVQVTLIHRGREILQRFDHDVRRGLHAAMAAKGIRFIPADGIERVAQSGSGALVAETMKGDTAAVDTVMLALGRTPNTAGLGLDTAGVKVDGRGAIVVDQYSRSSVASIYALGDVTNRMQLTPVAIHEAMCFVETEYKHNPVSPDYDQIATAIFSQPEIGTVGLSEEQAASCHAHLEIYLACPGVRRR